MSMDMTAGARDVALDSASERFDADSAPVALPGFQALAVAAATGVGIAVSAALGLVLFLR